MKISVVICTHNPRSEFLSRTLESLLKVDFPPEEREVILVDNASIPPVAQRSDITLSPQLRLVREEKPGLTPARICGVKESTGALLIFVDDDNLLDPDYLANAWKLSGQHPGLGIFSASIRAEWQETPPADSERFLRYLAIRPLERDCWSNVPAPGVWPIGAGMCVRSDVAHEYVKVVEQNVLRIGMDRQAGSLLAGGDTDLGYTCFEMGYGCGAFKALSLTHLIPSERVKPDYLARLVHDVAFSHALLGIHHRRMRVNALSFLKSYLRLFRTTLTLRGLEARLQRAEQCGQIKALQSALRMR